MGDAVTDAQAQQWLDYFATGASFDFHYDLRGLREHNQKDSAAFGAGIGIVPMLVSGSITAAGVAACFGEFPPEHPLLGISQYGLHLPLYPLVKWEDITSAWFDDLATTRSRAANGSMIPEVGKVVGNADKATLSLVVRNARLIRSTITQENDFADMGLTISRTGSGQEWGELAIFLDPALSPEQVVQFYYLFSLLAARWAIPIAHSSGMIGGLGTIGGIRDFIRAH